MKINIIFLLFLLILFSTNYLYGLYKIKASNYDFEDNISVKIVSPNFSLKDYENKSEVSQLKRLIKISDPDKDKNTLFIWPEGIFYESYLQDIKTYKDLFKECKETKNVNYYGYLENKKIIELLNRMHIFSYPSIWPETSCIAAIESMAAGCEVVTTNLGAMYETCAPFGTFVGFDSNFDNFETAVQISKCFDSLCLHMDEDIFDKILTLILSVLILIISLLFLFISTKIDGILINPTFQNCRK